MCRIYVLPLLMFMLNACSVNAGSESSEGKILERFAHANCLMWYFESKGYDSDGVRAISGGLVETSDISLEKFQEVALLVKDYSPELKTKHKVDINLQKCFYLDRSKELSVYFK